MTNYRVGLQDKFSLKRTTNRRNLLIWKSYTRKILSLNFIHYLLLKILHASIFITDLFSQFLKYNIKIHILNDIFVCDVLNVDKTFIWKNAGFISKFYKFVTKKGANVLFHQP